jgi:branched-chain amino acid transport system substrate-binding protein
MSTPIVFRRTMLVTALLLIGSASVHAQAPTDPIRIGFLSVRSGALAAGGKQMEEGIQLFLKEHNQMIAGRRVEEACPRRPRCGRKSLLKRIMYK